MDSTVAEVRTSEAVALAGALSEPDHNNGLPSIALLTDPSEGRTQLGETYFFRTEY